MKEKIKRFAKQYLIGFVIGIIVCGTVSVIAATYFPSNQTTYDNSVSGLQSTNVQDAIDIQMNFMKMNMAISDIMEQVQITMYHLIMSYGE